MVLLYCIFVICVVFPLFYLAVWVSSVIASKIFPRFSEKIYFRVFFFAPFIIEFMRVLAAFIVPYFGDTINLMAIYRQAQLTAGFHRSQVEVNAAALTQKAILKHNPIGSNADLLVEYMVKSGITCKAIKKQYKPWLNRYCYYSHWHPESIGKLHWSFDLARTKNNEISKVAVTMWIETD